MKKTTTLLALLSLPVAAQVRITEVMASSSHVDTGANGDWFEITNTGASAVNLAGYSWDDDSETAGVQIFPNYNLAAGQSAIVLLEDDSDTFLNDMWSIAGTKVFLRTEFNAPPGFGGGGDGVFLYNNLNNQIDSFSYTSATSGVSFARFTDGSDVPGKLSSDGQFGATTSTGGDIASPDQPPSCLQPLLPFLSSLSM